MGLFIMATIDNGQYLKRSLVQLWMQSFKNALAKEVNWMYVLI